MGEFETSNVRSLIHEDGYDSGAQRSAQRTSLAAHFIGSCTVQRPQNENHSGFDLHKQTGPVEPCTIRTAIKYSELSRCSSRERTLTPCPAGHHFCVESCGKFCSKKKGTRNWVQLSGSFFRFVIGLSRFFIFK